MIVLGADTHKRSHTIAAVAAVTGELVGEQTVQVGAKGFAALVVWARGLGSERVWAIEDCRHVSGSFERFLIARGERVLRVTTKLMADSRRRARGHGRPHGCLADARLPLEHEHRARAASAVDELRHRSQLSVTTNDRRRLRCHGTTLHLPRASVCQPRADSSSPHEPRQDPPLATPREEGAAVGTRGFPQRTSSSSRSSWRVPLTPMGADRRLGAECRNARGGALTSRPSARPLLVQRRKPARSQ